MTEYYNDWFVQYNAISGDLVNSNSEQLSIKSAAKTAQWVWRNTISLAYRTPKALPPPVGLRQIFQVVTAEW